MAGLVPCLAGDTISVATGRYGFDPDLGLLVVAMTGGQVQDQWPDAKDAVETDRVFTFQDPVQTAATGMRYGATDPEGNAVAVYFTDLPLIQVSTDEEVRDEPKVPGLFSLWSPDQVIDSARIGIEYRGGYSQSLPKKSFLIEFREDTDYSTTRDVSLLGLRSDDDWNLQAMAVEPLRLRSVIGQELWMDMHQPYYAFLEPQAHSGVRHAYAELFVNGSYRGLYAVGERVDRKQLALKKYNGQVRGALFKGDSWDGTTFTHMLPPYVPGAEYWEGYRSIYPEEQPDWPALSGLLQLVVGEGDAAFFGQIDQWFLRGNAIDYLIFLNVLRAADNTGKNIFVARYKAQEPFFFVPWDLDGSFGLSWDGSLETDVTWFLSNGLFDRWLEDVLPGGFRQALCERWWELRQDRLTVAGIMQRFTERHARLAASGVYDREEMAWPGYVHDAAQLAYMEDWLTQRLAYLDTYIAGNCLTLGATGQAGAVRMQVYPNPATDRVMVELAGGPGAGRLELFNALGQLELAVPMPGMAVPLDISRLAPGTYFLRLTSGNGLPLANQALVVQ